MQPLELITDGTSFAEKAIQGMLPYSIDPPPPHAKILTGFKVCFTLDVAESVVHGNVFDNCS